MSSSPPSLYSFTEPTFLSHSSLSSHSTLRPWLLLITPTSSITLPSSSPEATLRIKRNLNYFRLNYILIILFILFLSLLWHPLSLIVFLFLFVAWFFLFFSRNDPLQLFNRVLDDRIVLLVLGFITIFALSMTNVATNVFVSILIGVFLVVIHAAIRGTDDLYIDEQDVADGGLLSVVGSPTRRGYTRV